MNKVYIVPVSRLVERIKEILKQTVKMDDVWVQGEISNLTKHRSGTYYFSLKDEKSAISCVMFSSYVKLLKMDLEEGMQVRLQGTVNVYQERGQLQLQVKEVQPEGQGALYLEFEQRKKRLEQQGYFDPAHKKPKPEVIGDIGIITAKEGAALQDVLKTLHHRWPMMKWTLYPSLVQGNQAGAQLVEKLKEADQQSHDAILLVRGGGSFEDLFCFNDEELVKTIYHCQTYIVSGVGHQTDTTLTDFVSDYRAVTPTAAAQWVSLDQNEVRQQIALYQMQMNNLMRQRIQQQRTQLNVYLSNPYLQEPRSWLSDKRLTLDRLETQMDQAKNAILQNKEVIQFKKGSLESLLKKNLLQHQMLVQHKKEGFLQALQQYPLNLKNKLRQQEALLDAYSPLKVLARGYSVTEDDHGVISGVDQVKKGQRIHTIVKDGFITSEVIEKEKNNG